MINLKPQLHKISKMTNIFPASKITYTWEGKEYQLIRPEKGRIPFHYFIALSELLSLTKRVDDLHGVNAIEAYERFYNEKLPKHDILVSIEGNKHG